MRSPDKHANENEENMVGIGQSEDLLKILNQSSKLYIQISNEGFIVSLGSLWEKVIQQNPSNKLFDDTFKIFGFKDLHELKTNYHQGNVIFINEIKTGLKFKASFVELHRGCVFMVNPVINSEFPLKAFSMDLGDFPEHSYVAESIFLSEITMKGLHDAQLLNIKLSKRNSELKVSLDSVEKLRLELQDLNSNLEKIVAQKTKENIALNANLNEVEKFVAIGELTMGIAHDLNNPLSAILIGTENLSSAIEFLYQNLIFHFSKEEIAFAVEHSKNTSSKTFQSTLQMMKERSNFLKFLNEQRGYSYDDAFALADRMAKAGVDMSETSKIDQILNHPSPKTFLEMIYHVSIIHQMVTTISDASNRSAEVVADLRKFTKGVLQNEKERINVLDSINSVLRVLSSNYRSNISFHLDISADTVVSAMPRELFQIWSNIIKNAIEAIGEGGGNIFIRAVNENETVQIEFENDGPKIPADFLPRIFDRFNSSKGKENYGFGLNIVKRIIEDNNWKVEVKSSDVSTKFTFYLNA